MLVHTKNGTKGKTHANNAILPNQLHQLIGDGALGVAVGVGLEVAQIADVTLVVGGGAVRLAEGVDFVKLVS